ncbi:hypothetical protein [Ferrovibrio sp.]|uniref:hypothetical protein n=1 Tax=Ferrovibrio sp. TaxID=1917215 RepID=UPI000CBCAD6D|nr:hypothetical protein [Ferrovibrio sp.]PJI39630.1 MAG: hypothetical protein CTR53_12480 [Ferrovibrio sp.]
MTLLLLSRPLSMSHLPVAGDWLRPLLRRLAGSNDTRLPEDMEDWQLRDLALTRPHKAFRPGPCRFIIPWLP